MKYTSLDTIVRGKLLQTKKPIHYYVEFLVHAQRCLEELHFDVLGNVRTVLIDINDSFAGDIPCDCMDWLKVYLPNGQYTKPLVQRKGITRLNNIDANTGDIIPYPDDLDDDFIENFGNGSTVWNNTTLYNDHWEGIGRMFGSAGKTGNGFNFIGGPTGRNQIQFENAIGATQIGLDFISDGSECDNATKVNPYAKKTIEDYMDWQYKENNRSYGNGDRDRARHQFETSARKLRSRMNPMTINDIRSIVLRNTHGSLK